MPEFEPLGMTSWETIFAVQAALMCLPLLGVWYTLTQLPRERRLLALVALIAVGLVCVSPVVLIVLAVVHEEGDSVAPLVYAGVVSGPCLTFGYMGLIVIGIVVRYLLQLCIPWLRVHEVQADAAPKPRPPLWKRRMEQRKAERGAAKDHLGPEKGPGTNATSLRPPPT